MRTILVIAVIFLTACASTSATKTTQIPISVIGEGNTVTEAKNDGFQKAIEQEVGVVLVSNQTTRNNKLAKDEILAHSSGYVQDYKIHNTEKVGSTYYITMDVYIKPNAIAERILGASTYESSFDGEKFKEILDSHNNSRNSGYELLNSVLSDYPQSAFVIERQQFGLSDISTMVDEYRTPVFIIPYKVKYNYNFLKALNDTMRVVSDKKLDGNQFQFTIISKNPNNLLLGENSTYYLNDAYQANLIKKTLATMVSVRVEGLDKNGVPIFHQCEMIESEKSTTMKKVALYGNDRYQGEFLIRLVQGPNSKRRIDELHSFSLSINGGACNRR